MEKKVKKRGARSIIIAIVLLVFCALSITTMSYTLGTYTYTGSTSLQLMDNGFGVLDGESEMLRMVYDDYRAFQICSMVILGAGILSVVFFIYYLCTLFAPRAKLRSGVCSWIVSIFNLICSGVYFAEGAILVIQATDLFASFGMEEYESMITMAYIPIILSVVCVVILIIACRAGRRREVVYKEELEEFETSADGYDGSADLGMGLSYADGERLSGKDMRYLKKIKKLHDEGVLSDGEFAEEKARILNREFH